MAPDLPDFTRPGTTATPNAEPPKILAGGTYRTRIFDPPIEFTATRQWKTSGDATSILGLYTNWAPDPGTTTGIVFYGHGWLQEVSMDTLVEVLGGVARPEEGNLLNPYTEEGVNFPGSSPDDITVGGYAGLFVESFTPSVRCSQGGCEVSRGLGMPERLGFFGQFVRYILLDVEGEPLLILITVFHEVHRSAQVVWNRFLPEAEALLDTVVINP